MASVSRNSTHRRENDWRKGQARNIRKHNTHTSVSSVFSSSMFLLLLGDAAPLIPLPQNNPPPPEVVFPVAPGVETVPKPLIKPALSLSASPHPRIVPSNPSISNRFGSARGVDRKESRTLVTSRRSTLVSEDDFRRRRRASIRCSFMMTADDVKISTRNIEKGVDAPSCRSFPMRRFFSLTSCSNSDVRDALLLFSSNWSCITSKKDDQSKRNNTNLGIECTPLILGQRHRRIVELRLVILDRLTQFVLPC